jgi:hypothetical protein
VLNLRPTLTQRTRLTSVATLEKDLGHVEASITTSLARELDFWLLIFIESINGILCIRFGDEIVYNSFVRQYMHLQYTNENKNMREEN